MYFSISHYTVPYHTLLGTTLYVKPSFDIERIYKDIEIQLVVENVLVNHYENDVERLQDTLLVDTHNMTVGKS